MSGAARKVKRSMLKAAQAATGTTMSFQPAVRGTYWNGEPTPCERLKVVAGDGDEFPEYWGRHLAGRTLWAVRVSHYGDVSYLYDEDGSGWRKVTEGRGSPSYGHKNLIIEREV